MLKKDQDCTQQREVTPIIYLLETEKILTHEKDMEYYSAFKTKLLLPFEATQVNRENFS